MIGGQQRPIRAALGIAVKAHEFLYGGAPLREHLCDRAPKPAPAETWDCACGVKGLTGKFCPECGSPRPAPVQTWDCACGARGLTGKFCPECGAKRPEGPETWDCSCGQKGITGKFCPECGKKRGE